MSSFEVVFNVDPDHSVACPAAAAAADDGFVFPALPAPPPPPPVPSLVVVLRLPRRSAFPPGFLVSATGTTPGPFPPPVPNYTGTKLRELFTSRRAGGEKSKVEEGKEEEEKKKKKGENEEEEEMKKKKKGKRGKKTMTRREVEVLVEEEEEEEIRVGGGVGEVEAEKDGVSGRQPLAPITPRPLRTTRERKKVDYVDRPLGDDEFTI